MAAFCVAFSWAAVLDVSVCHGAVRLDSLGQYLTHRGYGGAQLVDTGKFYHLPFRSNGQPGHLVIDTGASSTLIFRSSAKRLGLSETITNVYVRGAFGTSADRYGVAVIQSFGTGNCIMTNVPVAIAPDVGVMNVYGRPNGLLGLRELMKFGAILDLPHRILYLRPSRPASGIGDGVRTMLESGGWKAVRFTYVRHHLRVPGQVDHVPCHFVVDTGAFLTALDRGFANANGIHSRPTRATAHGVGNSTASVGLATFESLWIGDYQIKKASATVLNLDPVVLGRGTGRPLDHVVAPRLADAFGKRATSDGDEPMSEVAGMIGIEYLALNSAIFDFVSGTLYLRPRARHH